MDYLTRNGHEMTARARGTVLGPIKAATVQVNAADFAAGLTGSGAGAIAIQGAGNPISGQIVAQAKASGVDPATATVIAMIESGMKPTAKNGGSHGVFQLQDARWSEMGGTAEDRNNPARQIELGIKSIKRTQDRLAGKLGRTPEAWEIYVAHQQGDTGGAALLTAPPEVNAASVLQSVGVSPTKAVKSITLNGGTADMTAGQYVQLWRDRFSRKAAVGAKEAATSPGATLTTPADLDLPTMLAAARAAGAGDPDQIRANEAVARARYSEWSQARVAREQQADDLLQPYLHGPNKVGSVDAIPNAIMASLSPQKRGAVYDHFAQGGEFAKTNDVLAQTYLSEMMVENPKAFASEDLTKYASKLTDGTYGAMLAAQRDARRGTGQFSVRQLTTQDVMRDAKNILLRNGMDPKKDKDAVGKLQQVMLDWGTSFVEDHKRRPTQTEINAALDGYLLKGREGGERFGRHMRVFEAGGARSFVLTIPPESEKRLKTDFLAAKGREPTRQELVTLYRGLHAAGKID
jgi:hypothetical protein